MIVKEALADGNQNRFTGAYRYDGYSLYDILNHSILKKKNETEFPPIIDLFVKVENDRGESIILSWGEIYYPVHRHEIIIATEVARIDRGKGEQGRWCISIVPVSRFLFRQGNQGSFGDPAYKGMS